MSDGGVHMPPDSDAWRIEDTAAYISDRKYLNVTAQFPDELLPHAVAVSCKLQRACHRKGHHVQVNRRPIGTVFLISWTPRTLHAVGWSIFPRGS